MNPETDYSKLTVSQARELADRAHQPQKVCEEHFYQRIKLFAYQQATMGHYKCSYCVPAFVLGLPLYNVYELVSNLEKRLKKEGWNVKASGTSVEVAWGSAPKLVLKSLDGLRNPRR